MDTSQRTSHREDGYRIPSPYRAWGITLFIGVALGLAFVYFANVLRNAPNLNVGLRDLEVHEVSLSSILAFYGILATIVVALAFAKSPHLKAAQTVTQTLRQEVQKNHIVVVVTVMISLGAAMAAVLYILGQLWLIVGGQDAPSMEAIVSIAAVIFLATVLTLMGSLVSPTPESMALQAMIDLPDTAAKFAKVEAQAKAALGVVPTKWTTGRHMVLALTLVLWPLILVAVTFGALAWLWAGQPMPSWVSTPLVIMILFHVVAWSLVLVAAAGIVRALALIRWFGAVCLLLAFWDGAVVLQGVSGDPALAATATVSLVVTTTALAVAIVPWIVQHTPRAPERARMIVQPVYHARLFAYWHAMAALKHHIALMESQVQRVHEPPVASLQYLRH